jgi:hypothetical protein
MRFCQTMLDIPSDKPTVAPVREGYGGGAWVVLSAEKR